MPAIDAVCKNKNMALLILDTIIKTMKSDTQKVSLKAVSTWIQGITFDDGLELTHEELQARIIEMETRLRDCMSADERRATAAFYLEGIEERQFHLERELECELIQKPELFAPKRGIGAVKTDPQSVLGLQVLVP